MKKKRKITFPKSMLTGKPCFKKRLYPSKKEAEKAATIMWGKIPGENREDLHGYECPDGCKMYGRPAWHIGHISYFKKHLENLHG